MFVPSIGYFIASVWLLQLAAANEQPSTDGRISNGQVATIDHFPYLMQIWNNDNFICGGSLVAPKFVVSAAHCFVGVYPNQVKVVGGATKLSEPGVSRVVDDIMRFDNFTTKTMNNDVAVLKLLNAMEGDNIGFIELYSKALITGMDVRLSGWGLTSKNGFKPSDQLRTVTVPITDWADCVKAYQKKVPVTKNMFCASTLEKKDTCDGDSGGPVVIDGMLAGIVSFGEGCGQPEYPGVYTDIQQVKDFIGICLKS